MKKSISFLYVPCPDNKLIQKIKTALLKNKLAACIQSFPVKSSYPWNGKIENADEVILIVKTLNKKADAVKTLITEMHSYEIPCIIHTKPTVNREYFDWMKKEMESTND